MRVTSYGLFWRSSEIDWHPGQGAKDAFRLLGRVGAQRGTIRIADFRRQQGIYILYDDYGPCYVGLTKKQGLGKRLKDHLSDHLEGKWDRFSWFGFWPIGADTDKAGVYRLNEPSVEVSEDTNTTIGDLEALVIRAIGPRHNTQGMNFANAQLWTQIELDEYEKYLARVAQIP